MNLPELQDNHDEHRNINLDFKTLESAIFYGLDKDNREDNDVIKKYYDIQYAFFKINIAPTEETRRVVEIAQRTIGVNEQYIWLIDNIQADYLEKLVYLNIKIQENLKKNNYFWNMDEINQIFKPVIKKY